MPLNQQTNCSSTMCIAQEAAWLDQSERITRIVCLFTHACEPLDGNERLTGRMRMSEYQAHAYVAFTFLPCRVM